MRGVNGYMKFLNKISKLLPAFQKLKRVKGGTPGAIKIPPSSSINLQKVILKANCRVVVGEQSQVSGSIIFDKEGASVVIGNRVFMNGLLVSACNIQLGDDILMAWGVTVVDHNSHSLSFSKRSRDVVDWQSGIKDWTNVKMSPVKISDKVWIGFNAILLKGIVVGEGAVVAAGAVVTKDVPPWTVVAGNPACVVKEIPPDER